MAIKYLVQHRRGTVEQWAEKSTVIPKAGEIVIEIDEANALHKLKIGDGVHTYAELSYLKAGDEIVTQVLAEAKPRVVTVELTLNWVLVEGDKYKQRLTLDNITNRSRLDLQPSADMISEFKQLGLVFVTENDNGVITVYSVGNMPLKSYTMQATIVETKRDGDDATVVGIPVGTPTAQSDWGQIDETKSDYIKNKPEFGALAFKDIAIKTDLSTDVQASLDKADSALQSETAMLSDLGDDATHRTVTDVEKSDWNAKATTTYVDDKVASMVDSAPETLDTLNELAAALGDDPNFATTVAIQIGQKVDKTDVEDVIRYTKQTLTEEQKGQVRSNIGAGMSSFSGSYDDLINKPEIPSIEGLATEQHVASTYATKTDLEGKAPAGYGLGDYCKQIDHWDNATQNGWYATANGSPTAETEATVWAGIVIRDPYTDAITQRVWKQDSTLQEAVRKKYSGIWQPWEWVNPPMNVGVEYRTTERYDGKAVYTRLIDLGTAVNGAKIYIADAETVFKHTGRLGNNSLPYSDMNDTEWYANAFVGENEVRLKCTLGWTTGNYPWYHQVWYTKD